MALARARWAAGSTHSARSSFIDAARAARRYGDAETLARAALGFAGRTDATPGVNREAVGLLEEALETLGTSNIVLRAELLARLGSELYHEDDGIRADALTREAVSAAEDSGDAAILGYALTARHFVQQRPAVTPQQRILITDRVIALTPEQPPSDVLVLALQERLLDQLELGDGPGFEDTFLRYSKLVDQLGQPFFGWIHTLFRGTRALLGGDVQEAKRLAHAGLEIGQQIGTPNAISAFAAQLFGIRLEQGRLEELRPLLLGQAEDLPELRIFRAGIAATMAATGTPEEAEIALREVMAHDLEDFPQSDHNWLGVLGLLAPAAAAVGNRAIAQRLVELFRPFSNRLIVVGYGAVMLGAVDHHLGTLSALLGDIATAERDFDAAVQLYDTVGALRWQERAHRERPRRAR